MKEHRHENEEKKIVCERVCLLDVACYIYLYYLYALFFFLEFFFVFFILSSLDLVWLSEKRKSGWSPGDKDFQVTDMKYTFPCFEPKCEKEKNKKKEEEEKIVFVFEYITFYFEGGREREFPFDETNNTREE